MIKLMDILLEGVNDPGIFKAVFLAGGPGSGKTFVVKQLFNGRLVPGIHQFSWDNKIHGNKIKAGLYLLDIVGDNYNMTKKLIIK